MFKTTELLQCTAAAPRRVDDGVAGLDTWGRWALQSDELFNSSRTGSRVVRSNHIRASSAVAATDPSVTATPGRWSPCIGCTALTLLLALLYMMAMLSRAEAVGCCHRVAAASSHVESRYDSND